LAEKILVGLLAFFWPQLKLVGLKKFVWPFYAEKVSSEGKYYYSILFGNTFAKYL